MHLNNIERWCTISVGSQSKGSILLVALSVTLCLLLLGAGLVALSYADLKQSVRQQRNAEALYIARELPMLWLHICWHILRPSLRFLPGL